MTRFSALLTVVVLGLWPSLASAQSSTAPTPRCSPHVSNRHCRVVIDANSPTTPLPLKMKDGATLTVVVHKRPLQVVEFKEASKEVERPDTTGAITDALVPGFTEYLAGASILTAPARGRGGAPPNAPFIAGAPAATPASIMARLEWVETQQAAIRKSFAAVKDLAGSASDAAKELNKIKKSEADSPQTFTAAKDKLTAALKAATSALLPAGQLAATQTALKLIIEAHIGRTAPAVNLDLDALLNKVSVEQDALVAEVTTLAKKIQQLRRVDESVEELTYANAFSTELEVKQGDTEEPRSAEVAISVTDVMSGESQDLVTVTGVWATTRWETSSGLLFSEVRVRTFSAGPRWENGSPVLFGDTEEVDQFVGGSVARPMVVPFAFVHLNLFERPERGGRLAVLATGGIGINPHSKFADFAYGGSLSYRNMYLSILKHRTRDVQLLGGLKLGDSLGPQPPAIPTQRFWVTDWSLALTLRVF